MKGFPAILLAGASRISERLGNTSLVPNLSLILQLRCLMDFWAGPECGIAKNKSTENCATS